MSISAILMMVVAMLIIWGGLALAVVNILRNSPEVDEQLVEEHRDL